MDVLIVGAGPAGATAALNLAPHREVLLVDRSGLPTPRIGESLAPSVRRLFTDMGIWEDFLDQGHRPCQGNRSVWGSGSVSATDFLRDPDGVGWHLDRNRFDDWLRGIACRRGAEVIVGASFADIREEINGWRVTLAANGTSLTIFCRFVIDATGRSATVARRLGANRETIDSLAAAWFYGEDSAPVISETTFIEAVEQGWWYTAPLPNRRRILAFHTDADLPFASILRSSHALLDSLKATTHLSRLLDEQAGFQPNRDHHVIAASSSRLLPSAGSTWIAAGDAAVTFDPLSSQGIFNAIYTGLAAAEAADRSLDNAQGPGTEYQGAIDLIWSAFVQHRNMWYGFERRWLTQPFWERRHHLRLSSD